MKFIALIYIDDALLDGLPPGEADEMMRNCLTHADDLRSTGTLLESQMLEGPETAKSIRIRQGRVTTTDGPFTEAKEVLGGFNLIEARDIDEAVRIATEAFPWARTGCIEVRPVRDMASVRRRVFPTACLAAAALLAGCQDGPTACDSAGRAGIVLRVTDAASGAPLADRLHGVARSDEYSETLIASGVGLVGLHERPGVYDLRVERDGYVTWDSTGVRIRQAGACHVATTTLEVPLTPDE